MFSPTAKFSLLLVLASLTLGGCATSRSGDYYTRDQARRAQTVETGVLEAMRPVQIEGTKTPLGGLGGAAIGGIAGSAIGGGRGSAVAAVAGAIAGGLAGAAIEEQATQVPGWEFTVRLDSGKTIAVVQEAVENEVLSPGMRVRILTGGGATRVTPIYQTPQPVYQQAQ